MRVLPPEKQALADQPGLRNQVQKRGDDEEGVATEIAP